MAISGFFNTVYPNFALVKVTFKIGTPEHGFISVDGIDGPHDFCGNKAFKLSVHPLDWGSKTGIQRKTSLSDLRKEMFAVTSWSILVTYGEIWWKIPLIAMDAIQQTNIWKSAVDRFHSYLRPNGDSSPNNTSLQLDGFRDITAKNQQRYQLIYTISYKTSQKRPRESQSNAYTYIPCLGTVKICLIYLPTISSCLKRFPTWYAW